MMVMIMTIIILIEVSARLSAAPVLSPSGPVMVPLRRVPRAAEEKGKSSAKSDQLLISVQLQPSLPITSPKHCESAFWSVREVPSLLIPSLPDLGSARASARPLLTASSAQRGTKK